VKTESEAKESAGGAKYATLFRKKLLGVNCDVDVVVDLATLKAEATISMKQILSSRPAFVITLDDLRLLETSLKSVKKCTSLLESVLPDATDHQLNVNIRGATAIVVRPPGKSARYTLSIGLFHREGELSELELNEIDDSIKEIEVLVIATIEKVRGVQPRNR